MASDQLYLDKQLLECDLEILLGLTNCLIGNQGSSNYKVASRE